MRIGIVGGTFNPFHSGHLETALEIKTIASLDRIIFIPCHTPPHKDDGEIIHPLHRYTMTVLGTIKYKNVFTSPLEVEKGGISYTYETIEALKASADPDTEWFFITGIESFEKITTWKRWEELIDQIDFIVNSRAGYKIRDMFIHIPEKVAHRCVYVKGKNQVQRDETGKHKVFVVETEPIDVSGSMIREKIKNGESIKGLLPPNVEKYININRLYTENVS